MSKIEKANAYATWWVGTSPKYGIECRIKIRAGFTDEECKRHLKRYLENRDNRRDEEIKKKKWLKSDEYVISKIPKYKQKAIDDLKKEIQRRQNENNMRFMGGYTGPAIIDHKVELDRIKLYEDQQMAQIEKDFDGSRECLERIRPIAIKDDKEYEERVRFNEMMNSGGGGGLGRPRVGGIAGSHAAVHGGGFNHPGVYAGGVW